MTAPDDEEPPSLPDLAKAAGMSHEQFFMQVEDCFAFHALKAMHSSGADQFILKVNVLNHRVIIRSTAELLETTTQ